MGEVAAIGIEAGEGVGGSPNGDDGRFDKRGEVHVGRIHAQQDAKVGDEPQFVVEGILAGQAICAGIAGGPLFELPLLAPAASE